MTKFGGVWRGALLGFALALGAPSAGSAQTAMQFRIVPSCPSSTQLYKTTTEKGQFGVAAIDYFGTVCTSSTGGGNGSVSQGTTPWTDNITQLGGQNISLGAGATDAGTQRVLANQGLGGTNPWLVQQQDGTTLTLTGTGSGPLLGTGTDPTTGAIVMDGYSSYDMQITAISGSNISVQKSNDNVTFYNENLCRPSTNAGNSTPSSVFASLTSVNCPASGKYTRLNSSGGTATVVLTRKVANPQPVAVFANLANASFTNSGLITVLNTSGTAGGVTSFSRIVSSAATTNATSAKTSAGRLYKFYACNTTTTAKFVKFYNLAVAPTVGTSTVAFSRMLPPASSSANPLCQSFDQADIGWYFSVGIAYAITGASPDNDTTALAIGDVIQISAEYQ